MTNYSGSAASDATRRPRAAAEAWVDGNELAGPLREIFAMDVTAAQGQCVGCGHRCALAEVRVYSRAPGLIGRCPACAAVLVRLVHAPARLWLDLSGLAYLEIATA